MTTCNYHFHPVGQGCFFTGIFSKKEKQVLKFVFDCGSKTAGPYLSNAIDQFKSEISIHGGKQTIDLLMISHFDADHVNGILELLSDVKCHYLVIPFLTVYERLVFFSKGPTKAEWHRRFLQNPQEFLENSDFDIDHIIFIDGNDQVTDIIDPTIVPLDPETKLVKGSGLPKAAFLTDDELKFNTKFHYFQIPFELKVPESDWKFKFFIKSYPQAVIDEFHNAIKIAFPGKSIINLFQEANRLKLKGLYKTIFKDINKSSLCVGIIKESFRGVFYHDNPNLLFSYSGRETTVLMTGDSSLKTNPEIADFKNHYKDDLEEGVLMFQIPHHGSSNNSLLDKSTALWEFPIVIVNHGATRKKHPSADLIKFITDNGLSMRRNTESSPYNLIYDVDLY